MNAKQLLQPVSQALSALAEPVRLRMLRLLEIEELSVGEVAKAIQMPQSTASRHLKTLSSVGLIVKRSVGTATLYRLVLDDLPSEIRPLWVAVRSQLKTQADHDEDLRRLKLVLAERKLDSKDFFGRVAGEWNEIRHSLFGEGFTAPALLALINPKWTVADLGCGSGDATRYLIPYVERVIAVDQSEAMLQAAAARLDDTEKIEFVASDLEELAISDNSVDAAVLSLVVHHVEDPSGVLSEARRILRTSNGGGVLLVIDMLAHDREEYKRTMGHRHLGFSREEISEHLKGAGFSVIRVHELPTSTDSRGPGLFVASARID